MVAVAPAYRPAVGSGLARDVLACLALIAAAVALGEASIFRRPDLSRTAGFLFGDPGLSLLVAREVLNGARLYADVAHLYGFVPVHLYAGVAAIFGNTPIVYLQFVLAWSAIEIVLVYALVRRATGAGVAFLVSLAGAVPVLLLPGSLAGGYLNSYYIPIERGLMLTVALVWRPASMRSPRRAAALGVCLGGLQFVRFGPGIALAAVVFTLDLVSRLARRVDARRWLTIEAVTFGAMAATEVVRIAGAFAQLPRAVARDVVWPTYVLEFFVGVEKYPRWHGWAHALGQALNPAASLALTLAALAFIAVRAGWDDERDGSQLILPLFFCLGAAGLFRSEFHFYQAAWTLTPGAALALRRWPLSRLVAAAAWLPPLALVVSQPLRAPPVTSRMVEVAPSWRLTVPAEMVDSIRGIAEAVRRSATRRVIFYPFLPGFNVALDLPLVGREPFQSAGVRPFEEAAMAREYGAAELIVTCRTPAAWDSTPGLFDVDMPRALRDAVEPRTGDLLWRDDRCRVVRLRPRSSPSDAAR